MGAAFFPAPSQAGVLVDPRTGIAIVCLSERREESREATARHHQLCAQVSDCLYFPSWAFNHIQLALPRVMQPALLMRVTLQQNACDLSL